MATTSQAVAVVMSSVTNASGEHVEEIIKALKSLPQCKNLNTQATKMSTLSGVKKSAPKGQKAEGKGPKRPLNSWMAFRKFYNQMLSPRTQKVKSKILTVLWKADPFEAKWSILAKSYSILRGNREKEEVSLDRFLKFCAPMVGMIPAGVYLSVMGWEVGESSEQEQVGEPTITRIFTPTDDSFPAAIATTKLSVEEIVDRCLEFGLFPLVDSDGIKIPQSGSLTMAVQPWTSTDSSATEDPNAADNPQQPLGMEALHAGTIELNNLGSDSDITSFDPISNIQNAWDPSKLDTRYEDGGVWDSFNLTNEMISGVLVGQDVDFLSFVNAKHIA